MTYQPDRYHDYGHRRRCDGSKKAPATPAMTTRGPESDWKPDYTVTPRRIVCAANCRRADGLIVCGARHWDKLMRGQINAMGGGTFAGWDQGFVDQFGDWIDRKEAWKIADAQGQIMRPTGHETGRLIPRAANIGDDGYLFSENLY
jgi:hypothetical protein